MSLLRRLALVSSALACAALVALAGSPGRAAASPLRDCTRTHGTIVAVDFAHWGGPIVRGCGADQKTGYDLLHAAGFATAGDQHDGPAFICRLGDSAFHNGMQYPTPKQDNCILTPPASAYWSYWLAPRGSNHWAYSQLGAMSDVPKPGEVELWTFGSTNIAGTRGSGVPDVSPDSLRPPRHPASSGQASAPAKHATTTRSATITTSTQTTPATATARTTATSPRRADAATHTASTATTSTAAPPPVTRASATQTTTHDTGSPAHRRVGHHVRRPAHTHHAAAHTSTVTSSTSTQPVRSSTTRAGGKRVVAARPTSQHSSSGSVTPVIIGVALALLLCAGAGRAIWQRRREE